MDEELKRPLKVFLCHASGDKPAVRALYQRLVRDGVDAWLDKEKLLPGQDWQLEIPRAVRESDVVVVCLSTKSVTQEGYVQKEIKFALDIAGEKPEGTIFLIPARLEECDVPSRLGLWQWVDLFEPDGYERLMRSLRLRADKLGMRVGDTYYTDRELDQRLDQLYTEGLAALWVEDWDKAYHRFQAILRDKPDHIQAIAKLDEAKRQKYLNTLYVQALEAQEGENWQMMVQILEKLTQEASDYKDTSLLLKDARKKNQLAHLYNEADRLYKAQQWQAVIKVFDQIAAIEPNYHDPDGLLSSAEKELVELKQLNEMKELYSRGVREMDAGNWYEARRLLEQVHKSQIGFLETERLLRKVENEINKIEELNKRNIYVNTLYEQVHELIRSKNWRKALEKIEEIQKLDSQFVDKDNIFEKARAGLDHEEEIVKRQNELAAKYTEAVGLLREGKYQEALDKWQEVKGIDPKYPDRQSIQRIASRKLLEKAKSLKVKPRVVLTRSIWIRIVTFLTISAVVIIGIIVLPKAFPNVFVNGRNPSTITPVVTSTSAPTPISTLALMAYDNFDDPTFDGKFNTSLWKSVVLSPSYIKQQEGVIELSIAPNGTQVVYLYATNKINSNQGIFAESKILLSSDKVGKDGDVSFMLMTKDKKNQDVIFWCGIGRSSIIKTWCEVYGSTTQGTEFSSVKKTTDYDFWHTFRIEIDPEINATFYIDGQRVGSYKPDDAEELKNKDFTVQLGVWSPSQDGIQAQFDEVWVSQNH